MNLEMIKSLSKYLREMAEPRNKIVSRIESQYESLIEHCIKAFIFKEDTENYNLYLDTIANILNYCNGQCAKTKSSKLKYNEYQELLFGIDNSYSVLDARNQIWTFQIQKGNKYPSFKRTDELNKKFHSFYKDLSYYFSNYMSKDKNIDKDKKSEFKKYIEELIEKHI